MRKTFLFLMASAMMLGTQACVYNAADSDESATADKSETVIENMMTRRSIRKYQDRTIARDTLDNILKCGIYAPNGMNKQYYEVKVIDDAASVAYLAENVNGLYKAPVYLFIAAGSEYDMSQIDVGLLAENVGLASWGYGIGSICLGMPVRSLKEKPELLKQLGFSEGYNLCLVMALGYPDETPETKPRNTEKVQYIKLSNIE